MGLRMRVSLENRATKWIRISSTLSGRRRDKLTGMQNCLGSLTGYVLADGFKGASTKFRTRTPSFPSCRALCHSSRDEFHQRFLRRKDSYCPCHLQAVQPRGAAWSNADVLLGPSCGCHGRRILTASIKSPAYDVTDGLTGGIGRQPEPWRKINELGCRD